MKYEYKPAVDILLITLSTEKPDFAEQKENIITHYNKVGKPIEIEILDASRTVLKLVETVFASRKTNGTVAPSV